MQVSPFLVLNKLFNSPYLADMDIAKRKHHIFIVQKWGFFQFQASLIGMKSIGIALDGKIVIVRQYIDWEKGIEH